MSDAEFNPTRSFRCTWALWIPAAGALATALWLAVEQPMASSVSAASTAPAQGDDEDPIAQYCVDSYASFQVGSLDDLVAAIPQAGEAAGVDPAMTAAAAAFLKQRFDAGFSGYWAGRIGEGASARTLDDGISAEEYASFVEARTGQRCSPMVDGTVRAYLHETICETDESGNNAAAAWCADSGAIFVAHRLDTFSDSQPDTGWVTFQTAGMTMEAWHGPCNIKGTNWFAGPTLDSLRAQGAGPVEIGYVGVLVEWVDGTRNPLHLRLVRCGGGEWQVDALLRAGPCPSDASNISF